MARHNLTLPDETIKDLERIAGEERLKVADVMRRFVRLGILIWQRQRAGAQFIIREGNTEQIVILL